MTPQRLDKWLWFARIVKSRSLAQKLVNGGHVRVNRDKAQAPAKAIRHGDVLTIAVANRVLVLKVLAPGTRRGPAPEARLLYEDLAPSPSASPVSDDGEDADEDAGSQGAASAAPVGREGPAPGRRERGSGRPTKRQRRQIDRLTDKG
ncbi:RNA-binding S4 domain-containing protein [Stappia indica]|uniref:RNA-binding S4 domain-containing protein n=1 Tax=Stappia indica TaxID=538381 RepID=A0A857CES3_9HYPH|nr:RNA-binding S4 domain-containing protein [Stappia indica]QGZ37399.1 RNA-binding S4 domain-containing protein [Stappia indica]